MSLIGIDLGSSNIKAAAYTVDGVPLASARRSERTNRTEAGHSEIDVFEAREAFLSALARLTANPSLHADPPLALPFSSSRREVCPAAGGGTPLGARLVTARTRGGE